MPCAAPGEFAWGALRRKFLESAKAMVRVKNRCLVVSPYSLGMDKPVHPHGSKASTNRTFTQHSSGFGVERGCKGVVVSLVGDCRPPPPGNPHRPTTWRCTCGLRVGTGINMDKTMARESGFISKAKQGGRFDGPNSIAISYNTRSITSNLKELNPSQYFKNTRSYFYCMWVYTVLEFQHDNSHLCGLEVDKPPSIAVTNVLKTKV